MAIPKGTHPKQIVDANGHLTTRHVSDNKTKPGVARLSALGAPVKPKLESHYTSPLDRVIRNTPLKEMSPSLLAAAIQHQFPSERVGDAIAMASYLHRFATRGSRGNQPREEYISHPLRNSLRAIRFGCSAEDIAIANILHDTVEDCAVEMIAIEYPDLDTSKWSEQELQDFAIDNVIEPMFGKRVAKITRGVSNPPMAEGLTKNEKHVIYRAHVLEAIEDEDTFIVKCFDLLDNAGSLHHHLHEKRGMVISMSGKYLPLFEHFIERLQTVEQIPEEGKALLEIKLREVQERLTEFSQLAA